MKFGERIHAEAVRSGQPEEYLAYNTIKRFVKDEDVPAVQEHLSKEMEKVDAVFRQEEFECSRIFNELQKEGWNCAAVRESSVAALQNRINQLVAFGQWNYTAVEKITKKIRRRLGQGILSDTTPTMLSKWYPYSSMEPARMLAMLRDVPTRPDSSHTHQRNAATSSRTNKRNGFTPPAAAAATEETVAGQAETPANAACTDDAAAAGAARCGVRRRRPRVQGQRGDNSDDGAAVRETAGRSQVAQLTSDDDEEEEEADVWEAAGQHQQQQQQQTAEDSRGHSDSEEEDSSGSGVESDSECSGNGCPVCLTTRMEEPALCSCAHTFCFNCISQTETCPVCRKRHFSTFVMAGSGEIVTPNNESALDGPMSLWWVVLRRVRDIVWYLLVLALLLPFLAALFTLGFLWSGIIELIDLVRGKQTVYPVPLSYKKFPLIAPHGLTTAPPPWSQPSLWE